MEDGRREDYVAPLAGAWVEISTVESIQSRIIVAPLAGAWVEILYMEDGRREDYVAPLAGAWVEIIMNNEYGVITKVAPLAGAWVEILRSILPDPQNLLSLPSRERGLKSTTPAASRPPASGRSPRGSVG